MKLSVSWFQDVISEKLLIPKDSLCILIRKQTKNQHLILHNVVLQTVRYLLLVAAGLRRGA